MYNFIGMEDKIKHILDRLASHEIGKTEAERLIMAAHAVELGKADGSKHAYVVGVSALHFNRACRFEDALREIVRSLSGVSIIDEAALSKMYDEIHPQDKD